MNQTKICTKCNQELDANTDNFVKAKNGKYGLSAVCKSCQKEWRDNRKDIKKNYDKNYNQENADKRKEYSKKRYYEKYEDIQEYNKNRYKDVEFVKRRREYRKSRKERDRELYNNWRKNNTDRISTNKQRRYTKQKGLESNLTHEEWLACKEYFNNSCAYCGEVCDELTRDHLIPVTKDGTFTKDNVIPACRSCNSSKNNKDFDEWYTSYEYYSEERKLKIIEYILDKNIIRETEII